MLSENKKIKIVGTCMLIASLYLSILPVYILLFSFLPLPTFTLEIFSWLLTWGLVCILFPFFSIYFSRRYMTNRPFKQNKILGKCLIILGVTYFLYELLTHVIFFYYLVNHNFFSTPDQPSFAYISPNWIFIFCLYLILFGIGFNYFGKTNMIKN